MEKRLIDANALLEVGRARKIIEVIGNWQELPGCAKSACVRLDTAHKKMILDAPTVDAVEVVHGEWTTIEDDYCGLTSLQCSECNQEYWFEDDPPRKIYNYCPNCGAKMDGERKDND